MEKAIVEVSRPSERAGAAVTAVDFDEIQALMRMTQHSEGVVADIARATLAIVESRRDAEIRAAIAEAALATERAKLAAIRDAIAILNDGRANPADTLRHIASLAN